MGTGHHSHHATTFYGGAANALYNLQMQQHLQAQPDGLLRSHRQPTGSAGINPNPGNNSVKNKKSLIHFRGTMKNNFFSNNQGAGGQPSLHGGQDHHITQSGVSLTLNHGDSNTLLIGEQHPNGGDSMDPRGGR